MYWSFKMVNIEECVDELVETTVMALQGGKEVTPTYFVFTDEKVFSLDTDEFKTSAEMTKEIVKVHKEISPMKYVDIFVSECKLCGGKLLPSTNSEDGETAVLFLPIDSSGRHHPARVIPFTFNPSQGLLLRPEQLINFTPTQLF
jgi:hypothetical protein